MGSILAAGVERCDKKCEETDIVFRVIDVAEAKCDIHQPD